MDPLTCGYLEEPFSAPLTNIQLQILNLALAAAVRRFHLKGYQRFLCGGGPYGDLCFAETVLDLRRDTGRGDLTLVVPAQDYAQTWPRAWSDRLWRVLRFCDHVVFLPGVPGGGGEQEPTWRTDPGFIRAGSHRLICPNPDLSRGLRLRERPGLLKKS